MKFFVCFVCCGFFEVGRYWEFKNLAGEEFYEILGVENFGNWEIWELLEIGSSDKYYS